MNSASLKPQRCAIYTRVSTDSGLEQEFNSLDAQREAAQAYVKSQAHEGWILIRERYDDGGFSGGSLDRPAMQKLLADIKERRIDVVVVYKVDRLTRSLTDFAKLVEVFDAARRRLRLGHPVVQHHHQHGEAHPERAAVLCPVRARGDRRAYPGQDRRFEEEGPLGRRRGSARLRGPREKLFVNEDEAATVRLIFSRYLELGSLPALQRDLRERGIVTRRRKLSSGRVVGRRFLTNGPVNYLLRNRVYLGEINHRGKSYPGEHKAILEPGLFDAVQAKLDENRRGLRLRHQSSKALLLGKLFDDRGNAMTPSYAIKKGVRYRYYVSCVLAQGRKEEAGSVKRVAALTLEQIVINAMGSRRPI